MFRVRRISKTKETGQVGRYLISRYFENVKGISATGKIEVLSFGEIYSNKKGKAYLQVEVKPVLALVELRLKPAERKGFELELIGDDKAERKVTYHVTAFQQREKRVAKFKMPTDIKAFKAKFASIAARASQKFVKSMTNTYWSPAVIEAEAEKVRSPFLDLLEVLREGD